MAIDSPIKRASVLGIALTSLLIVLPDNNIDGPDRQTLANKYSGIIASVLIGDTYSSEPLFAWMEIKVGKSLELRPKVILTSPIRYGGNTEVFNPGYYGTFRS